MLSHIHISNLGIIEDIEIDFGKGLNIITGETGAGKTLIIGAIQILCGAKVGKDIVRNGEDKAFVEALFYVEDIRLKSLLEKMGYDDDEIVLSREIMCSGRSVAKINGRLVTIAELRELGENLVDLHGQHDNQSLLDAKKHIDVIDAFAGKEISDLKKSYSKFYEKRREILDNIARLGGEPDKRLRTIEFLKFQIDEIQEAKLKVGEDDELREKKKVLANAEKIAKSLAYGYEALSSEDGIINILDRVRNKISDISSIDKKYEGILKTLDDAYYQIEDISRSFSDEANNIYIDENELNDIDERLDLIFKLKKKYGNTINDILISYENMQTEYKELCDSEEIIDKLNSDLENTEKELMEVAKNISDKRKEISELLENKLEGILKELEMPKAKFKINVISTDKFLANGMNSVEILFSSNAGEEVKPLSKVASGGEISRIMLALKNVFANADTIPVLVFDEIDTGISGKAGFAVGEKMKEIAKNKQVICVTHLPSIVAKGSQNYYISKNSDNNKTVTSVKKLNEEETVYEIARIISGGNISETALLHAREIRST